MVILPETNMDVKLFVLHGVVEAFVKHENELVAGIDLCNQFFFNKWGEAECGNISGFILSAREGLS